MKLFFKFNFRILSLYFAFIFLFSSQGFSQKNFEGNKDSHSLNKIMQKDGIGFLSINAPISNAWSLLCPLAELLAQENVKAVVLYGIQNVSMSLAWACFSILQELRVAYNKPIIAYTDSVLKDAATYVMCCGADAIVIAPWSKVCGIELSAIVTFFNEKDKAEGKILNYIFSGKFKDENSHMPLKPETIKRIETTLQASFDFIVKDIISRRPNVDIYQEKWIHGNSLNAQEALTYGLIDGIVDKIDLVGYVFNFAGYPNRNISNVEVITKHPYEDSTFEHKMNSKRPKVGILKIHALGESSWNYAQELWAFFKDETIDKIVLDICLEDERQTLASNIYYDIVKLKRIYKKPVVAYVNKALAGGYYIASSADYIIANPAAWIGSIGTCFYRWDFTQKIKKEHLKYLFISTGKYMDLFNEKLPLNAAGKDIMQKQLNFDHAKFVQDVKIYRQNLKKTDDSSWSEGQIFIAQDALKLGLIDAIGTPLDALNYGNAIKNNRVHELSFIFKASQEKVN